MKRLGKRWKEGKKTLKLRDEECLLYLHTLKLSEKHGIPDNGRVCPCEDWSESGTARDREAVGVPSRLNSALCAHRCRSCRIGLFQLSKILHSCQIAVHECTCTPAIPSILFYKSIIHYYLQNILCICRVQTNNDKLC